VFFFHKCFFLLTISWSRNFEAIQHNTHIFWHGDLPPTFEHDTENIKFQCYIVFLFPNLLFQLEKLSFCYVCHIFSRFLTMSESDESWRPRSKPKKKKKYRKRACFRYNAGEFQSLFDQSRSTTVTPKFIKNMTPVKKTKKVTDEVWNKRFSVRFFYFLCAIFGVCSHLLQKVRTNLFNFFVFFISSCSELRKVNLLLCQKRCLYCKEPQFSYLFSVNGGESKSTQRTFTYRVLEKIHKTSIFFVLANIHCFSF